MNITSASFPDTSSSADNCAQDVVIGTYLQLGLAFEESGASSGDPSPWN